MSILRFKSAREIVPVSTGSVAAENRISISRVAREIAAEIGWWTLALRNDIARGSSNLAKKTQANVLDRPFLWLIHYCRCADEDQRFGHCDQNCCNQG
jgi:hypothetical protein